uniref:protein FLX-like 4 n=1 Tax=Erigeron canadensis TaxID=72917 RepID=UPI001CB8FD89|nr:protein FLX-like 4 [Erigeron canadensis]
MSARGHGLPGYGSRSTQTDGLIRHGLYSVGNGIESQHSERGDSKLVAQSAELERLVSDNKRLATAHVALRQDLAATQQDIQKLRAHIGSIQTESDLQIRIFLEKMTKMEVHLQDGESVKKELQKAHTEARALVVTRQELIDQVTKATQELEKIRADVKNLPILQVELDGLRKEHQKLRLTFEHEKGLNMEKVAQMEVLEKDLVGMAKEVERLRAEVLNAEKKATAPNVYGGPYMTQESYSRPLPPPPPPHMHTSVSGYVDGYGNHHHVQMGVGGGHPGVIVPGSNPQWRPPVMVPYGAPHPGPVGPGSNPQWGGQPYDHSYSRT